MRLAYMFHYAYHSLVHKRDIIFSMLNIFSVAVTMLVLVSLAGILKSFKDYTENILQQFPLRIDLFTMENVGSEDLKADEEKIKKLEGVKSFFKRVTTNIQFFDRDGNLVQDSPRGSTVLPQEPLDLKDIQGKPVRFLSKEEINSPFDEIGIIVSFDFLKNLGYFPQNAFPKKPETWEGYTLPSHLKIYAIDGLHKPEDDDDQSPLSIPVVGVVENLFIADYIITEDFYTILLKFEHPFTFMLKDRYGKPIMAPEEKLVNPHYVLKAEEADWIDLNLAEKVLVLTKNELGEKKWTWVDPKQADQPQYRVKLSVFFQSYYYDRENDTYEDRLAIKRNSNYYPLTRAHLEIIDQKLREFPKLKNLDKVRYKVDTEPIEDWKRFKIEYDHQYIQGSLYTTDRKFILPLLSKLQELGLYASSPLKDYIKTFDRQERFFVWAAITVFLLILFLSAIVMASTFYASVQRKRKQIGILKACGASRSLIRNLLYLESLVILAFGMAIGIPLGILAGWKMKGWIAQFVELSEIQMVFTLSPGYISFIAILVSTFCWIAIFIPAQIASSTDAAQAVRH